MKQRITGRIMKLIKSQRGQSLVELGVSLLILLYLLSGAAEFGILFFQYVQLRDAAQEGALYGSMNPYIDQGSPGNGKFDVGEPVNQANIETRARAASSSPIDLTDTTLVTVVASSSDGSNLFCEGHGIQVTVSFRHKIFMPFMPQLLGRTSDPYIDLNATVVDTILTPIC
jgi:Flp pilus assembly protein TadG